MSTRPPPHPPEGRHLTEWISPRLCRFFFLPAPKRTKQVHKTQRVNAYIHVEEKADRNNDLIAPRLHPLMPAH